LYIVGTALLDLAFCESGEVISVATCGCFARAHHRTVYTNGTAPGDTHVPVGSLLPHLHAGV
jgi:hypothetical protein